MAIDAARTAAWAIWTAAPLAYLGAASLRAARGAPGRPPRRELAAAAAFNVAVALALWLVVLPRATGLSPANAAMASLPFIAWGLAGFVALRSAVKPKAGAAIKALYAFSFAGYLAGLVLLLAFVAIVRALRE